MSRSVYINATGSFFPNEPVSNDKMESVLGQIRGRPSKSRSIVLASNQIRSRHYAIDPATRKPTHNSAQLAANAVRDIFLRHPELDMTDVDLLCCGTTVQDLIVPGHGQMVQGELKNFSGEVISTSGVCCSSASALKAAYLAIKADDKNRAIVTGSEAASKFMRSEFFESESEQAFEELKKNPLVSFSHDFLRWMLSDGGSALYLSSEPMANKTNLRINWIEGKSYANEQPVCMFAGGYREENGEITSWKDLRLEKDSERLKFAMNFQQDVRMLKDAAPTYTMERPLTELKKKYGLKPGDYTWFLPHYSSHFFYELLVKTLAKIDFSIPTERWFSTLYDKGNIGSASIFAFIDELLRQKTLHPGEKILCFVPESARMSAYFFELEVV